MSQTSGARRADLLAGLAALVLSAVLAVQALGPLLADPQAHLVGEWTHPDNLSNQWLLAWVAETLAAGGDLLHNDRYYWPVGDAPLLAGNGAEGFLYAPLHWALGWPDAVPVYVLLVLVLNGFSGWVLARAAGAGPAVALVGVAFSGASPYVFQELTAGRFSQADIGFLLLSLASGIALLRRPGPWTALALALSLALTSALYWYYGFFSGLFLLVLCLAWGPRRLPLRHLALALGGAALLVSPWLGWSLSHWAEIPGTDEAVFPHPEALLDVSTWALAAGVAPGREAVRGQPLTLWLLSMGGALGAGWALLRPAAGRPPARLALGLLLAALLFRALSFGPIGPWSPFSLLYGSTEPLRRFWWPLRHSVGVMACDLVLAAWLLHGLLGRLKSPGLRGALSAGLPVLLALTAAPLLAARGLPAAVVSSRMTLPPPGYPTLAALPDGVLLEVPLAAEVAGTQQHLIYQRIHHKTLVSGHAPWVRRVRPAAFDARLEQDSFLRAILRVDRAENEDGRFIFDPDDLRALQRAGLRYVGLPREAFPLALRDVVAAHDQVFAALFGAPIIQERGLKIWDVQGWTGASEVEIRPLSWPDDLARPLPDQPLVGRRTPSLIFPDAPAMGPQSPP